MRTLTTCLLGLALALGYCSPSWAIGHHHNSVEKAALKDVKKARHKAAKADRPKHHIKKHKHH